MPGPEVVVLKVSYLVMKNYNYLAIDPVSHQAVVIDPAWQIEKIEQALTEKQASLSGILITHSHPDHIHLAKPLAKKYGCPIWMSKPEIAVSGFDAEQLVAIDETQWFVGQMQIQAIPTPGHTPGGTCYLIGDNLFTGDTLFIEGCGICPDFEAAHTMFASLSYLKKQLKPETHIFPGHSYGKQPGEKFSKLLKENIYLQFTNKEDFAAFRLRKRQNKLKMFDFS